MKAFLFDLNGTMVDDMNYHITAWHKVANSHGAGITWERMKAECYGKNEELVERILPGKFTEQERYNLGYEKERQYREDFKPFLKLIDGLDIFLQQTHNAGIKMGIGSAGIMPNIEFVVDGLNIRHYFGSLIGGDSVAKSKPDPETFLRGAADLGIQPQDCIVFEDSPKGVKAATAAGMKSVVITTLHTQEEFNDANILCFIQNYDNNLLAQLQRLVN
jgi:beta-phosphoglucomutase